VFTLYKTTFNLLTLHLFSVRTEPISQQLLQTSPHAHCSMLAPDELEATILYRVLTTLKNLEISGNLLILENSGNLKDTQGIYQMLFFRDAICV